MAGELPDSLRRALEQPEQPVDSDLWGAPEVLGNGPVNFNDWYNLREGGISRETYAAASQLTVYDAKAGADPEIVATNRRAFNSAFARIPGIEACLLAAGIDKKTLTSEQWENLPVDFKLEAEGILTPLRTASGVWRQFIDSCDHKQVNQ